MNLADTLLDPTVAGDDAPAVWWRDQVLTRGALRDQSARLAGGLASVGVRVGDRVAIVCANNPYFVVTYLAVLRLGAIAVPVNPMAPAAEMVRELRGTTAAAAVVGPAGSRAMGEVLDGGEVPGLVVVTAGASPELPGPAGATAFDDLLTSDPGPVADRSASDPAVLAHTSGTSGAPRAAILTHGSLAANLAQAQRHPVLQVRSDDVVLGVLPLFHSYGLNVVLGLTLAAGAQVVLAERFDPHGTLELVQGQGVTVLPGVPPMFSAWLGFPDLDAAAFATVRVAVSGAAPLPVAVQKAFWDRFHVALQQGYGLTEASPMVTTTGAEDPPRPGSIGVPLPGVEVRLADPDGDEVYVGDPGEILVRGDNVFAGYWHDDEATARVLDSEGWLHTGDVAVADDDGFLSIVDRSKDLIIVSGFNVYPAEVEDVLAAHEGVAEAAVVGVPHPHTGEAVKAYVVPRPGAQLDEEELVAFCARSLARYKCPGAVEIVEALPRGLAGKLLRRELESATGGEAI